jgi:hypothetical protein
MRECVENLRASVGISTDTPAAFHTHKNIRRITPF